MPNKKSIYWLSRAMADEARAQRIADGASEEIRQMYRRQYLKVVQQITNLKAELDAGRELTRTQLWNYSRWSQLEEELKSFVTESTRFNIGESEKALNEVFEKTIGATAESFSGSRMTLPISAHDVINTAWSGERYSARIWKNQAAIADRLKNSMEDMLVQGRGLPDIKKQIMKEFNVAYNDADRLVRTEAAYVLNRANVAKYRQAGLKKIEWSVGPEDGRECAVCAARGGKVYLIDEAPIIPAHPRCRCIYAGVVELSNEDVEVDGPAADAALEAAQQQKKLQKAAGSGIIEENSKPPATEPTAESEISTKAGGDVNYICKLDRSIYSCVSEDITTDEVVITDERIQHIKERHPNDFERYWKYLRNMIISPQYIIEDDVPNTAFVLKQFDEDDKQFRLILKLHTEIDENKRKNSVITFQYIKQREFFRLIRNKKVLYKAPKL